MLEAMIYSDDLANRSNEGGTSATVQDGRPSSIRENVAACVGRRDDDLRGS